MIIGVGNAYRHDDGVGLAVVRRLRPFVPAGVTIIEGGGEGATLMESWQGAAAAILVDAVHSGASPGTIHRLDAQAAQIPSRFFHYSTHAFGVAEAVELARAVNQLPPRLIVYGIEGRNFAAGEGFSAEVEQAATAVAAQVLDELSTLMERGTSCTNSPHQLRCSAN